MDEISHYLTEDHEHCDSLFAEAENAVSAADGDKADERHAGFVATTLRHGHPKA